ncbi:HK97 family phage prohead protease [Paenirhodobacter populi]|uniref:HK97 family phage prohead protease n=1 Tax=Paenirhodobacter populi TaxID=2306993 RepID=UPI0013E3E66E|nr:HK97 family phage prohead protease [Sinirhodobacter populi]
METKLAKLDADALTEDGLISGYASRFGVRDQGGDIVVRGAYKRSLSEREPAMLRGHEADRVLGVWTSISEDDTGLRVTGKLALGTTEGREAYELIKMGALKGLSIGYRVKDAGRDGNSRLLKEVELWEVSIVTFPMQMEAGIDAVKSVEDAITATKSGDFTPLKKAVEAALRDAGFPAWMAKAQAALAPNALRDVQRDADAGDVAKAIRDAFKL